jgi:uncharacterized protein
VSTELVAAVFGLSGIASGFLAGLFGIGGGLIMVPVLVYAFKTTGMAADHVSTMALGTSMAAIVFSSAQSAYGHYCKGSASVEYIRRAAPWVVAGVLIGGAIAARTPAHPLLIFMGGFQLFAAFLMVTDVSKLVTLQSLARGELALGLWWRRGNGRDRGRYIVHSVFQSIRNGAKARDRHISRDRFATEPGRRTGLWLGGLGCLG